MPDQGGKPLALTTFSLEMDPRPKGFQNAAPQFQYHRGAASAPLPQT